MQEYDSKVIPGILERFCIPNFGMFFDCAFPKKVSAEKRHFQCFAFRKSDSTSFPRVAMQNKMESVESAKTENLLRPNLANSVLRRAGPTAAACDGLPRDTAANFGSDEARTFAVSSDPTEPRTKGLSRIKSMCRSN